MVTTKKEKMDSRLFKSKEFEERFNAIEKRMVRLKEALEEIKEKQESFS